MRLDALFHPSELAVDLLDHPVKRRALIETGFARSQIAQAVAHEVQRDFDDVQRLSPLLQVAIKLDLGHRDQVEMIGKPRHLVLDMGAKVAREAVRAIVNGHFHFGPIIDRSGTVSQCRPALG